MPAVTTELEWTTDDLLRFMIQTGPVIWAELCQSVTVLMPVYSATDWDKMAIERWNSRFRSGTTRLVRRYAGNGDLPNVKADLELT
jgi:hypothetical protein